MKKFILILFSAVLFLSCSADEVSREGGNNVAIPEYYQGHWKEDIPNGVEMWVEEQRFIIKVSETRTDTITEWYTAIDNPQSNELTVHITEDLRNSISIHKWMTDVIRLNYRYDDEFLCSNVIMYRE